MSCDDRAQLWEEVGSVLASAHHAPLFVPAADARLPAFCLPVSGSLASGCFFAFWVSVPSVPKVGSS